MPSWYTGKPSKPEKSVRKIADARDKKMAKQLHAKTTPNSGSRPMASQKGDHQGHDTVVETKGTDKDRLSIGPDVIGRLCRQAVTMYKQPILVMTMEAMPEPLPKTWVCMPIEHYDYLKGLADAQKFLEKSQETY